MSTPRNHPPATVPEVGLAVDRKLQDLGVVVTAGGEPTFIANDYRHAEWNVAALGPTKMAYGRRFAAALRKRLAPGCLVTHTMGKLYPGEPLPRWSIGLHWREGGAPLAPEVPFRIDRTKLQKPEAAAALAQALPAELGMKAKTRFIPALEEASAVLQQLESTGRKIVPYFKPGHGFVVPKLTAADKAALKPFAQPVGWVLPLAGGQGAWVSNPWPLPEPGDLVLWPGQSPIGLRLPLHLLPPEVSRLAMTVEVREGELGVFMPPVPTLDDYLDLLGAVQRCVRRLKLGTVVIEGYAPPNDGTVTRMNVIADPGVLEVNLPPAADTAGYARYVDALYEAAPESGLRSWKYKFTGRKVGTGGGAHILLGGPTAETSPFFLQPRLLPGLIRFFQHHPSLSFLFTGLFTGPSSQAPRVDESEYEVPYELEIALRGVETMPLPANRELIDRMLRNLLMDTLGNTHRAEISIDKLWNPYAPNGQLGLAEFRAFEMPPAPEMLMAVVTLLRAIAAALLARPFAKPLKRWGHALHDQYAMPHFLKLDLLEVIAFLNRHGFAFTWDHFEPWFQFRFPVVGTLSHAGREIEFRQAIEPWPVLGEQPDGGGVSRFVDSSTDRLQIAIPDVGWAERHLVLANGIPLRFFQDRENGRLVGAVRYRMYACVPGLQPHIAPHSPLRFELVEAATRQVVAAKTLRNWRPDDQPYSGLPQNDEEAALRVAERFTESPEFVGERRTLPKAGRALEGLYTTDLRFYDVA